MIAIAHKNPNIDSCGLRREPDLAELGFLQYLVDIMDGVQVVYNPGARLTILTEGMFYQRENIFDVSVEEIEYYEKSVAYFADSIGSNRIKMFPLQDVVKYCPKFNDRYLEQLKGLSEKDYEGFIDVMDKSMTSAQKSEGKKAEDMARSYRALHKAKHLCREDGTSAVYYYLAETLGPNYIYCSVTITERPEVLVINPYRKYRPPFLLPQHGIGVLLGGTSDVKVVPFTELAGYSQDFKIGSVVCEDLGQIPLGYVDYGVKRR